MNWRSKTEKKFEVFSDWLYDNSTKIILIVLLFVGALGTQLPTLKMDTSTAVSYTHLTLPTILLV